MMMNSALKISLLIVYLLALLHFFINIPYGGVLQIISLLLIASHTLELAIFYRHVKKYQGSLVASIGLTLLLGLLHWLPLSRQQAK